MSRAPRLWCLARTLAVMACIGGSFTLTGCSSEDAGYAPYEGEAYPNERPQYAPEGRLLGYVANRMSDSISVIDLDSMTELGQAPVGRDPVDIDGPRHIVLDEERELAHVVLSYPLDVPSAHVEPGEPIPERASYVQTLALHDLRPLGELRVQPNAEELARSPDGTQLIVSHYDTTRALQMQPAAIALVEEPWTIADGTASASFALACIAPAALTYGADESRAYLVCTGDDTLAVVDATTGVVISRTPSGEALANKPYAITLDPAGQHLAVSNQLTRVVALFTTEDEPALVRSIAMRGIPFFAEWLSATEIVVPLRDPSGAARVDVENGELVEEATYASADCENPSEARLSKEGRLFLVCEGDHYRPGTIVEIDPETLEILATVSVGIYPDRLALRTR